MSLANAQDRTPFWWMRYVPVALLAILVFYLLVVVGHAVFIPLLLSFALTFMLEPLVDRFERYRLNRHLAVLAALATTTLGLAVFLLVLVPSVWSQLEQSIAKIPAAVQAISALLHDAAVYIEQRYGEEALAKIRAPLDNLRNDPSAITSRVGSWLYSGVFGLINVGSAVLGLLIVPFFVYYLLVDLHAIRDGIDARIPERFRGTGAKLFDEIGDVVRGYVRGRLILALAMSAVYAIGLLLLGVPLWAGIGLIAGFIGIIPYLGVISGFLLAVAFAALDGAGIVRLGGVAGVFLIAQAIEDYVLTPRLIGDRLELHPMLVFIALIIAGDLFGLVGLVLAIPFLAVAKVLFKFFDELYRRSDFFSGATPAAEASAARVREAVKATTGKLPKLPIEKPSRKDRRATTRLGSQ